VRSRRHGRLKLLVLLLALLCGCTQTGGSARTAGTPGSDGPPTGPGPASTAPPGGSPSPSSGTPPAPGRGDPYAALATQMHKRGVAVWFETDLVKSWLAGPAAFQTTMTRLASLAQVPGVVGFKIADELGYHDGLDSPAQARKFLTDSRAALHRVAPQAKILVDAVVPELGCLAWTGGSEQQSCAADAVATSPAASVAAITGYLRAGLIDTFDLSTGLLDPGKYQQWGTTVDGAQVKAWAHVNDLGWPGLVHLQSRKALAAPGGYQGSPAQASADVRTYVTLPREGGSQGTDIWTWRQSYSGAVVSLLPPSLASTPFWNDLVAQHRQGVVLMTNITPSQMPAGAAAWARECDKFAEAFDAAFVAAGTG
jgi:hypothetical protein